MRVLIAMEDNYRIYRSVMASGLSAMRPRLQVATAGLEEFEERLKSFKPQVVICGGKAFARSEEPLAWMDLAFDSVVPLQRPARIWVGNICREMPNPDLGDLLSVIDEVDQQRTCKSRRENQNQVALPNRPNESERDVPAS